MDLRQPDADRGRCRCRSDVQVAAGDAQRRRDPRSTPTSATRRADDKRGRQGRRQPAAPANVEIDLDRFEARGRGAAAEVGHLRRSPGGEGQDRSTAVAPRAGTHEERARSSTSTSRRRKRRSILDDADEIEVTFDGRSCWRRARRNTRWSTIKEKQSLDKPIELADIEVPVEPRGGMATDLPRRLSASSATSSTTRACTASTGTR